MCCTYVILTGLLLLTGCYESGYQPVYIISDGADEASPCVR
jgi:hypothetical protein